MEGPRLDMLTARELQEPLQSIGHPKSIPVRREAQPCTFRSLIGKPIQLFVGTAACQPPIICFGEANERARTGETLALLHKVWPQCCWEHSCDGSCIDEIKRRIRKGQWVCGVHRTKRGIFESLGLSLGLGIANHFFADVDADDVRLRGLERIFERPVSWTTGNV